MKNRKVIIFLCSWIFTVASIIFTLEIIWDNKNTRRSISSDSSLDQVAKIRNEEGEIVYLEDYLEQHVFGDDERALDEIIRNFYELKYASTQSEWAFGEAEKRYLEISEKLQNLRYALATASVQAGSYNEADKATLIRAIESYYSGLYVLSWHHAFLFHRNRLPLETKKNSCIDFSKIRTWEALRGCSLPLEKEFALLANEKLGGELINVPLLEKGLQGYEKDLIQFILKSAIKLKTYVAIARLDLSQEMRNFIEHNSIKDWRDPYFYAKFLTFSGLREAMGNYWSLQRYQQTPTVLIQHTENNQFLLTANSQKNETWNKNNYIRELFNKDFYYNGLNSYVLGLSDNKNEVFVNDSIWGEIFNKTNKLGAHYFDDGRFCKSNTGCKLNENLDRYLFVIKSLFGTEKSCESELKNSSGDSLKYNCISRLRNFFYQKGEFWFVNKSSESLLENEIFTNETRSQIQSIVKNFLKQNPGLVTNAMLPGDDFSSVLTELNNANPNVQSLSEKILAPSLVAKNILITNALYRALAIESIEWTSPLSSEKIERFSDEEKQAVYKAIYCRSAEVMWGVNPKELSNDIISCSGKSNIAKATNYFSAITGELNNTIATRLNTKKVSFKNLSEKYDELMFYSNLVGASSVAKYLREGKNSTIKLRPFDRKTLEIYAKIMTGNLGKSQMLYSGEKNRFRYMENTGFLDIALSTIEYRYSEVCKRAQKSDKCNPLAIPSNDDKARYLRRAVYEAIYGALARIIYPYVKPENYVTPNKNAKLNEVLGLIESGNTNLPDEFGVEVKKKFQDYFYYVADQTMNFKCEESIIKKTEVDSFQGNVRGLGTLGNNQLDFIKSSSLNSLIAKSSKAESNWEENFYTLMREAGQWKIAEKCGQAKDFFQNGYSWILLGKSMGLFNLDVIKNGEFSLVSYSEEPKIIDYNLFHSKYVYQLLSDKFPFLALPSTDKWYGESFLDLQYLKPQEKIIGIEQLKKSLSIAQNDFLKSNGEDFLNFYSRIKFESKNELSAFQSDKNFEKLFEHFESFRAKFTAYHLAKEKILISSSDTKAFLKSPNQLEKWMGETADKKIVDAYHPWEALWEKVKSFLTPVIIISATLSIFGWILGGVEFLGVALLSVLLTADTVGLAIIASDSAYNLIYKNMVEIPSTISAQSKVASSFSFYAQSSLPDNGSGWKINLKNVQEKTENLSQSKNVLSDQIWSQGISSQKFEDVQRSKQSLSKKRVWDSVDLGINVLLFYLPVAPQIKRNFQILKQGRTLEQVLKAAGLPYMNFPQRVRYFFGKSPEVLELVGHLENRPLKSFIRKASLSIDPKSQVVYLNKHGTKNLEEAFLRNLILKDNASREAIHLLYPDASKRSLNPKIDLMHEELELYVDFMKAFVREIDKLPITKHKELVEILKEGNIAEHVNILKNKVQSWVQKGSELDKILSDEVDLLIERFGNMPVDKSKRYFDLSKASLVHANNGDLLTLKLSENNIFKEQAASSAMKSFLEVEDILSFYDELLNISKYKWHEVSEKYLQAQLRNTLKLEENIFSSIKSSKQVVPHGQTASAKNATYVEQLTMQEKLAMEEGLSRAWMIEIQSAVEGSQLGLMMMLRDFQGMHASLNKSAKLQEFIKETMGNNTAIYNYMNYINRTEAPLYAKLLSKWSKSGNIVQKMNESLEKLEGGAGFYHYVEVPMSNDIFRNSGLLNTP